MTYELGSIRRARRSGRRVLRLHPPSPRLAHQQHPINFQHRARRRDEHLRRRTRPDCRGVDLQGARGETRISDGTLDECGVVDRVGLFERVFAGVVWGAE